MANDVAAEDKTVAVPQPVVPVAPAPADPVQPVSAVPNVRGLRLDQLMLMGTVALVMVIVALSGVLQVLATSREFNESSREQTTRLQTQAKEIGRSISRLVSMTSASALRDNNYGFLDELVKSTSANDPNVLRVQILDPDGNSAADTDNTPGEVQAKRTTDERVVPGTYKGHPVFEYQMPVQYSTTSPKGLVVLTYSLEALQDELRRLDLAKKASIQQTTRRTVILAVAFVLVSAILAWIQSRTVTRPLAALTSQAMQLAEGNMEARVARRFHGAGREVRTLGAVFNHMADQIVRLVDQARRKAGLEQEMQLARKVQETLLPGRGAFEFGALRIAGQVNPADQCGGDWWLRAPLDPKRIAVGIGDVTGHGLSTALIATSAISGFAAVVRTHHPDHIDSELLMQALNQTLFHVGHGEYQMSCAMMVFDVSRGEMLFANGGHPFPCVYNRGDGQVTSVVARGPLVGKANQFDCKAVKTQLRPGDVLIWYSDGLLECRDPSGQQYGWKRLSSAVQRNGRLGADQLRDALMADALAFTGPGPQEDDVTVLVVEYVPR